MFATRGVTLQSGVAIEEGQQIQLALCAANRDPTAFGGDANSFRLGRTAINQHVSFGQGLHRCLGDRLAKLEMRVALQELTRRLSNVALHGDDWRREPGLLDRVSVAKLTYSLVE